MYARLNSGSKTKTMGIVPESTYNAFNRACTSPIYATANAIEGTECNNKQQQMRVIPENTYEEIPAGRVESNYSCLSWEEGRCSPRSPPPTFRSSSSSSNSSMTSSSNVYDQLGGISGSVPESPLLKRKGVIRRKITESGGIMAKANRPLPAAPAAKTKVPLQRKMSFKHSGRSGPPASVINAAGAAAVAAVATAGQRLQRLQSNEERSVVEDEIMDVCVAMFDYVPPVHQIPIF